MSRHEARYGTVHSASHRSSVRRSSTNSRLSCRWTVCCAAGQRLVWRSRWANLATRSHPSVGIAAAGASRVARERSMAAAARQAVRSMLKLLPSRASW
jgi:hypothetical protein